MHILKQGGNEIIMMPPLIGIEESTSGEALIYGKYTKGGNLLQKHVLGTYTKERAAAIILQMTHEANNHKAVFIMPQA